MTMLFSLPTILKVAVVFGVILVLLRYKYQLGSALLIGSILLGLWSQMTVIELGRSVLATIFQPTTLVLCAIVTLIMILSHSMDKLHQMKRLLTSFQGLVNNAKFNLVVFPALIGLLPMPGGAIFSAPMVEELGKDHHLDAETKTLINYWFRHIWEFAWPLYPGVLMAASLAMVNVWVFVGVAFPLTLVSILAGYVFLLKKIDWQSVNLPAGAENARWSAFVKELIPIGIVIIGALSGNLGLAALKSTWPLLEHVPTELPLLLALCVSIGYVWWSNGASGALIRSVLMNRSLLKMIYMVAGIYIFKGILVDSHAVSEVSTFLAEQNVPLLLVIIVLPAFVGMISGISVAVAGTTFPILISLIQTVHPDSSIVPYIVLAFCSGFIGIMFSPLHVCFVFTQQYFKADFRLLYPRLWKPLSALLLSGVIYFSILVTVGS